MAHIVVMGAGIGGIPTAYELKEAVRPEDKITVINNRPYFQFTPSNPWAAVGWRKREDITIDMAPVFARHGIDFIAKPVMKLHPEDNRLELEGGEFIEYDYLVIATGPRLAFERVEGLGPEGGHTHSVCTIDHAEKAYSDWEKFCADPGPIVVGAAQMASCFGPAYEFAAIMDTDLKKRGIRDKVPMTFVTSEPYIGHLGLGGVGDTKGMLESEFRDRNIKWITNARIDKVEPGKMHVTEVDEDGNEKKKHELDFKFSMILPSFAGVDAVFGIEGLTNPGGFIIVDKHQRNRGAEHRRAAARRRTLPRADMERHVPGGSRQHRHGLLRQAAESAAQRYFLRKVRKGVSEPFIEKYLLGIIKMHRLKS